MAYELEEQEGCRARWNPVREVHPGDDFGWVVMNRPWMPLWLATYIFIIGWLTLEVLADMFIVMAAESDIVYIWYYGTLLAATTSLPWIWYSTYLGYRCFDEMPKWYYLLIAAPVVVYIFESVRLL